MWRPEQSLLSQLLRSDCNFVVPCPFKILAFTSRNYQHFAQEYAIYLDRYSLKLFILTTCDHTLASVPSLLTPFLVKVRDHFRTVVFGISKSIFCNLDFVQQINYNLTISLNLLQHHHQHTVQYTFSHTRVKESKDTLDQFSNCCGIPGRLFSSKSVSISAAACFRSPKLLGDRC